MGRVESVDTRRGGVVGELLDFTLEFPFQLCVFREAQVFPRHCIEFTFSCCMMTVRDK